MFKEMAWKSRIFQIEHSNKNGMNKIFVFGTQYPWITQSTFICRDFYSNNIPNIEVVVKEARENML